MPTTTAICIYCLAEKSQSEFNREHVLPESFGAFENSLVLHSTVCQSCNQAFGDSLDLVLSRDSFDGLKRYDLGVKPPADIRNFRSRLLEFRTTGVGVWSGLRMRLGALGGERVCDPLPQVGFRRRLGADEWIYLTEWELADPGFPLPELVAERPSIHLVSLCPDDRERLVGLLARRGVNFKELGPSARYPFAHGEGVDLEVLITIDQQVQRAIAKIAFNYLAHCTSGEFVRGSDFQQIRRFVREGIRDGSPFVSVSNTPVLYGDSPAWRKTNGHLLILQWFPITRHLIAKVSLFNHLTYTVSLTQGFSGIWRPIRSGHHFDLVAKQARKLGGI